MLSLQLANSNLLVMTLYIVESVLQVPFIDFCMVL